ncbi:MAG: branched-chain amino acid ABC transporter permease [Candidatus Dormiibacterota bacterium]
MHLVVLAVGFGLVTASVLALASVGLTLQFGVTNYVNFAFGDFLTVGAYLAWTSNVQLHLPIWAAALIGALGMGLAALVINRLVLQPFVDRRAPLLYLLIVTFGLSLILNNGVLAIWGPDFQRYAVSSAQPPINVGPFVLTATQLVIIGVACLVMIGVHLLLTRTKLGKAMRAMSDNPDLARVSGIDTGRVTAFTWFLSGGLAGLAGVVLALNITAIQPSFGSEILFVIFAAVILGGIGSAYGAMLGALVIGLVTEISAVWLSSYKNDVAFAVLILVLLLRPNGLIRSRGKA